MALLMTIRQCLRNCLTTLTACATLDNMVADVNADNMAELRIRNLPENVRTKLKLRAVLEQTSLNGLVIGILSKAVASTNIQIKK
jgi:hypothetical protein